MIKIAASDLVQSINKLNNLLIPTPIQEREADTIPPYSDLSTSTSPRTHLHHFQTKNNIAWTTIFIGN